MSFLKKIIHSESIGGILLFTAALLAIIICNTPWLKYYQYIVHYPITFSIGEFSFSHSVLFWINDWFMALFFLVIGLEINCGLRLLNPAYIQPSPVFSSHLLSQLITNQEVKFHLY